MRACNAESRLSNNIDQFVKYFLCIYATLYSCNPTPVASILCWLSSVDPESSRTVIFGRPLPSFEISLGLLHSLTRKVFIQAQSFLDLALHALHLSAFHYDLVQGFCVVSTDYTLAVPSLNSGPEGVGGKGARDVLRIYLITLVLSSR